MPSAIRVIDIGGSTKQIQYNNSGEFGGATGFEWQNASPNVTITAQNAAHVPLLVKAAASQSANIQELQDSTGNVLAGFDSAGRVFSHLNTQTSNFIAAGAGSTTLTGINNILIGSTAGDSLTDGHSNVCIGPGAGTATTTGDLNLAIGLNALTTNIGGSRNFAIGPYSGQFSTGQRNFYFGYETGRRHNTGNENVFMGYVAGRSGSTNDYTADSNVIIGAYAAYDIDTGSDDNVVIGHGAGYNLDGDSNIFIGYQAGYNEVGSNKLYIENSNSATPLVYGEFDNDRVFINGDFGFKVYSQDAEPTLGADNYMCIWKDTNDSNRIYLVFRRGNADHVKVELT